jgi:RHS repeat-associated protein
VHQVAEAHGWRYTYNANGDVTQRLNADAGLSIEYDAHRGIRRLELVLRSNISPIAASEFRLDSADQRYQRRDFSSGSLTRITTYVGSLERIEHQSPFNGADREARLTLALLHSGSVIVTTKWSGATRTDQQRYVLRDHLGSADVIVRPDGTADETLSFDAHGRRRNASSYAYLLSYTDTTTRRGYTGHEHLDALGLVHMNARIYDPILGRFLQADTLIEADATQGLNRYTYVLNNALTHTDPTGRSLSPMARTFLSVMGTIFLPGIGATAFGLGGFGQVVFAGFVSGSISGGLKGGVIGAFSAGLFHGIGSTFTKEITPWAFNGNTMNLAGRMAKTVAHGTAGGVMQSLQGGKFGHGFVSAAGPELLHPVIGKLPASPVRILSAALVGGSVSSATGGKFASGAVTAAFMWAFNHEGTGDQVQSRTGSKTRWTASGVKTILKKSEVGKAFLDEIQKSGIEIKKFESATDTYIYPDGRKEVVELNLAGNYRNRTIRLNASLSSMRAAQSLYHEYQHHLGANELDARIMTEQFAIDAGMNPTSPGYRTQSNEVNIDFIKVQLGPGGALNGHYSNKIPSERKYSGESRVNF